MGKITAVLFDFDGVVADTEGLYAVFWGNIAERYRLNIPDFTLQVKGMTMGAIFEKFFPGYPEAEKRRIIEECMDYEYRMEFREVPGATDFIQWMKDRDYRVGLVTSSPDSKLEFALERLHLSDAFDTIVSADRIVRGKPDPMCYRLAAADLKVSPNECVVFEDSFFGIEAGKRAGMRVIGLSTTNPAEKIAGKADAVIPDFTDRDKVLSYFVN